MLKRKKRKKFCPKCGKELRQKDEYCISCGYSFKKRKKKINLKNIIILIIIFIILWIIIRMLVSKPILPQPLLDLIKNFTIKG